MTASLLKSPELISVVHTTLTLQLLLLSFVLFWMFFPPALADGFSLEFEWQQVSSSFQDYSQYSGCSVVGMVSTRPVISKSSSSCSDHLVTVPREPITIGSIAIFMFHSFFNPLRRSRHLSLFSHSFNFTWWSAGTVIFTILQVLFFVDYYKTRSSRRDMVIPLYLEIPEEFVCLILLDRFWVA